MKIRILSVALVASVLLFTQCKKDDGVDTPPTVPKDYSALTAGSTFTFRNIVTSGSTTDTTNYTLTVGGADTLVNGKTYKRLTNSTGVNDQFMVKVYSNYFQLAKFAALNTGIFENNYLNDSLPVNAEWTQTINFSYVINGSNTNLSATLKYKITEKAATRTVNGKAYTDVIHVNFTNIAITGAPVPLNITAAGDSYYSLGYGIIESTVDVPTQAIVVFGTPVGTVPKYFSSQILMSSVVK